MVSLAKGSNTLDVSRVLEEVIAQCFSTWLYKLRLALRFRASRGATRQSDLVRAE